MTPPNWLDKDGKAYFRRVAKAHPELSPSGLELLALGASAYSTWRNATQQLEAEGRVITSKSGTQTVNPWHRVAKQAFEEVCRVYKELGLKKPTLPDDELDAFMSKADN